MGGAARREIGKILIYAADVTVARFRRKAELRRGEFRRGAVKERRLEKNAPRSGSDLALLAAHNTGNGVGALGVTDHKHRRIKLTLNAVERLHSLAVFRGSHDDLAACELRVIESMHRLAKFHKDIIGYVDDKTQRSHAAKLKTLGDNLGRRAVLDGRDDAGRIARTLDGVFDDDGNLTLDGRIALDEIDGGLFKLAVKKSREFAGKSVDAQRVGTVPGNLDFKNRLGLLHRKNVAQKRAGLRLGRKFHNAVVIAAWEIQFGGTAAHAERLDAAELTLLDLKAAVGNYRTDLRKGGLNPGTHIRRAAYDLEDFVPVRYFTDVKMVGIGVGDGFEDFADDEKIAESLGTDSLDGLDLQSGAGQFFGELFRIDVVDFNKFIQPTERELHLFSLLLYSLKLQEP